MNTDERRHGRRTVRDADGHPLVTVTAFARRDEYKPMKRVSERLQRRAESLAEKAREQRRRRT